MSHGVRMQHGSWNRAITSSRIIFTATGFREYQLDY